MMLDLNQYNNLSSTDPNKSCRALRNIIDKHIRKKRWELGGSSGSSDKALMESTGAGCATRHRQLDSIHRSTAGQRHGVTTWRAQPGQSSPRGKVRRWPAHESSTPPLAV